MSATNAVEAAIIALTFNATTWADFAENDTTGPLTAFHLGLATADPGEAGSQTTNETSYTSYARQSVNRNSGGFTCSGSSATLTSAVNFPAGTGGSGTITHFSIGKDVSGAGTLYFKGTATPNQAVGSGVTPQLTTATAISLD
jgi:hypothetical protein